MPDGRQIRRIDRFAARYMASLLQLPERGKEHLPELIGAMELLSQNAGDKAGQAKLLELRNALKYE